MGDSGSRVPVSYLYKLLLRIRLVGRNMRSWYPPMQKQTKTNNKTKKIRLPILVGSLAELTMQVMPNENKSKIKKN